MRALSFDRLEKIMSTTSAEIIVMKARPYHDVSKRTIFADVVVSNPAQAAPT
jgi:hypothetical protein